jgi:hypothetical protein
MATNMEAYQFERGRYEHFQDTVSHRVSCAPTPAARKQIYDEGDQIRARMEQLADQVRSERNAAPASTRYWTLAPRNATTTPATPAPPPAKGSNEERYHAAVDYVRRAIAAIMPAWWNIIERPAAEQKTAPYQNELTHIEARWSGAKTDQERAAIARDAELLADHTQETMPGAPQNRQRTNLWKGETPKHAPATSYLNELVHSQPSGTAPPTDEHSSTMTKYLIGAAVGVGAIVAARAILR